jgi:hypothetical protein
MERRIRRKRPYNRARQAAIVIEKCMSELEEKGRSLVTLKTSYYLMKKSCRNRLKAGSA